MFIPFISSRSSKRSLGRRKGGGGKGGGGGSSSGGGGGGGGRSSSSVSSGGSSRSSTPFGNGGGATSSIPSGQAFAGRTQGSGTRGQVAGTGVYGSGYPASYGYAGAGVAGRGFPFFFWPVAWGGAAGLGTAGYYHTSEYGNARNGSRPGGTERTAFFKSISSNTTLRIMADNSTVTELIFDVRTACNAQLDASTSTAPTDFDDSGNSQAPRPEQAIQYYRASSVALTLDGYNNTGAFGNGDGPMSPVPSWVNSSLVSCVNSTIVAAVPLLDAGIMTTPNFMMLGVLWVGWFMSQWI